MFFLISLYMHVYCFFLQISWSELVCFLFQQVLAQSDAVTDKLREENEVLKAQVWTGPQNEEVTTNVRILLWYLIFA